MPEVKQSRMLNTRIFIMATNTCIKIRSSPSARTPSQACPETPYGPSRPRGAWTEGPFSLKPTGDTGLNQLSFAGGSREGPPADIYGVVGSADSCWSLSDHRESDIKIVHDVPRSDSALGLSTLLDTSFESIEEKETSDYDNYAGLSNLYSVLPEDDGDCLNSDRLRGKAKTLVRWFKSQGIPLAGDLPERVRCGQLRKAVRQCFSGVSLLQELSFKTVQKLETHECARCDSMDGMLEAWTSARLRPVDVDQSHLERFTQAFSRNVPEGWDDRRRPFIPNGHATETFGRCERGNWNKEEFSDTCQVQLVWSSGKPRVITMYSAENTRLLAPLHYSLHSYLSDMGWLLVGPPTEKDVARLNGADFLSFDYSSATDNIKVRYVQAAVDVLKRKAKNLTEQECAALDVLCHLKIDGEDAHTGQPMGSVMSFPLLCLINKTTVDLSMDRLLGSRSISFREWSSHRCLINGDDLLLREPRPGIGMRDIMTEEGGHIGLVVNLEKSMSDPSIGEINSTLFDNSVLQKKFNAAAVWMDSGVNDVLGYAWESSSDLKTFKRLVRCNAHILAKQEEKNLFSLPWAAQAVCRKDAKIRRALTSSPAEKRPIPAGVFRMADMPENYVLTRDEENVIISEEVERLRPIALTMKKPKKFKTSSVGNTHSYTSLLRRPVGVSKQVTLSCLSKGNTLKIKESLVSSDPVAPDLYELPPHDVSRVNALIDYMRAHKREAAEQRPRTYELEESNDYVSLF